MNIEHVTANGIDLAVISSGDAVITGARSALELARSARYETGAERIVTGKRPGCGDFFILSTGLAGEILQKFVNYHVKAAIYGDYSHCTSKPRRDFIYESNKGKDFFFVPAKEEAMRRLTEIP